MISIMMPETLPSPFDQVSQSDLIVHRLQQDEVLFVQNARTTGLYYLSDGTVDLTRVNESGHNILIHRARAEDTFAEASLFSEKYHCTATAIVAATVVECRHEVISKLLATDLNFARLMVKRFALQIQQSRRRIELLSIRSADERVLAAIADGLLVEDIVSFADTIGLAAETVYRSLAALTRKQRIRKVSRGCYELNQNV